MDGVDVGSAQFRDSLWRKQTNWPGSLGVSSRSRSSISVIEEKWELSSDEQQFLIYRNIGGISKYLDIYARRRATGAVTILEKSNLNSATSRGLS